MPEPETAEILHAHIVRGGNLPPLVGRLNTATNRWEIDFPETDQFPAYTAAGVRWDSLDERGWTVSS